MTVTRQRTAVLAIAVFFAGLLVNVLVQDGLRPFLIVLAAVGGCLAVVLGVLGSQGYLVAEHAKTVSAEIQSGNHPMKKELAR